MDYHCLLLQSKLSPQVWQDGLQWLRGLRCLHRRGPPESSNSYLGCPLCHLTASLGAGPDAVPGPPPLPQVVDLISLKPFDMETISKSVRKTRRVIIVEECMKTGGIGASLSAVINESLFNELDHEVCRGISIMSPMSQSVEGRA